MQCMLLIELIWERAPVRSFAGLLLIWQSLIVEHLVLQTSACFLIWWQRFGAQNSTVMHCSCYPAFDRGLCNLGHVTEPP